MPESDPHESIYTPEAWAEHIESYQRFVREAAAHLDTEISKRGEDRAELTEADYELSQQFLSSLVDLLQDEVVIAHDTVGGEIASSEREREVAKKALSRLKVEQLRNIAESNALSRKGKEEELLDRIVTFYEVDQAALAELVLANEEARPERGISDRLFPLLEPIEDLMAMYGRLQAFQSRYIRTGIAKWFLFTRLELANDGELLILQGKYRTYRADAVREFDSGFDISAVPTEADVRIVVRRRARLVYAQSRGLSETRAAITALLAASGLRPAGGLPLPTSPLNAHVFGWDPRTLFMVSLLEYRLSRELLHIRNLSVAQFSTDEMIDASARRPSVRSVRLEGTHILDSQPACELIVEGKALTDISLFVKYELPNGDVYFAPVRVTLSKDHIVVLTGFSTNPRAITDSIHRALRSAVESGLGEKKVDETALASVARKIAARAVETGPVETADIFAPSPDDE